MGSIPIGRIMLIKITKEIIDAITPDQNAYIKYAQHTLEAELDQHFPAKEKVSGSNPL
jgi:hypothetical protein